MLYRKPRTAIQAAIRDLSHPEPRVRVLAAEALGQVQEQQSSTVITALRPLLNDDSPDVRYMAALSLGRLGDRDSVEALIEMIRHDQESRPRQAAVVALGEIGDPRATDTLIEALETGSPDIRFQATTALTQVNPTAAAGPLLCALSDEDPEVRGNAAAALGDLGDSTHQEALAPLLGDEEPAVRMEAAMALARLGDKRCTPVLVEHLQSRDFGPLAAEHLFLCPDLAAGPALLQTLKRWFVPLIAKVWSAGALARMDREEGRRFLISQLRTRQLPVKGLCIQVLGSISSSWSRDTLRQLRQQEIWEQWYEEIDHALNGQDVT